MTELSDKKINIDLVSALKFAGAVVAALPLLLAFLEYKKSVKDNTDKNFREIVTHLSSEKKTERLASATNLGTFINADSQYNNDAIDILVNMILIESDTDILQAISSSLKKIEPSEYASLVDKLIKLDSVSFTYQDSLEYKLKYLRSSNEKQKSDIETLQTKITKDEKEVQIKNIADKLLLESYQSIFKDNLKKENELDELLKKNKYRKELISNFTISILANARKYPITGLELYQNSWNYVVLLDLKLPEIIIKNSALGLSTINGADFHKANVISSAFSFSSIKNTNFSGSTISTSIFDSLESLKGTDFSNTQFKDVFFAYTNVSGANFTGAKGLEPLNFYKATNLNEAIFDEDFKKRLAESHIETVSEDDFKKFLTTSSLNKLRRDELLETINNRSDKKPDLKLVK